MKAKIILGFLLVSFICFSFPLFGQDRLVDNAGILSSGEAQSIEEMLNRISTTYDFDLVIVTENSIGSARVVDYADDFFDYNGYGLGDDFDGCLFLIVMDGRDYCLSTSGRALKVYNELALDKLESEILKHLKKDNFYEAYLAFGKISEEFLILDEQGRSYGFLRHYFHVFIIVSWVLALLTGLIVVAVWKRGMNNVLLKTEASSYIIPGSLSFTDKRDRFLYSTVSRSAKPKSSSSSGGSSHTSSSGRSHGGRSGKF